MSSSSFICLTSRLRLFCSRSTRAIVNSSFLSRSSLTRFSFDWREARNAIKEKVFNELLCVPLAHGLCL